MGEGRRIGSSWYFSLLFYVNQHFIKGEKKPPVPAGCVARLKTRLSHYPRLSPLSWDESGDHLMLVAFVLSENSRKIESVMTTPPLTFQCYVYADVNTLLFLSLPICLCFLGFCGDPG